MFVCSHTRLLQFILAEAEALHIFGNVAKAFNVGGGIATQRRAYELHEFQRESHKYCIQTNAAFRHLY